MSVFSILKNTVTSHKETFALAFSSIALIVSFGKEIAGFILPQENLVMVVSEPIPSEEEDSNPMSVTTQDGKLRLDPRLHISFINSSDSNVLVRSISLVSPKFESKAKVDGESCDSDNIYNMAMWKFQVNLSDSRRAVPFSVAPGQIVAVNVDFEGIPDIHKDVNVAIGIPLCIHIDTYDYKGRHHDFTIRAFDITDANEEKTTYVNRLKDKGLVVLAFSKLWSLLH